MDSKTDNEINNLTQYEKEQVNEIKEWKKQEPGVLSKTFGVAVKPLAWLVNKIVPEKAIRGVLDFSNSMAQWLSDTKDIKRDGKVKKIERLKTKSLKLSDHLANEVHNWAIGMAVAEGAGAGAFGLAGMAVDIPTIITIALRTIHKIGLCYGYEANNMIEKEYILGILSVASSNTVAEKNAALAFLKSAEVLIIKTTWKKMAETAAQKQLSKEAGIIAIKNMAKQLGVNLTKRKALAAIPVIGAAVGGSVNGWYMKEVGWAARHKYQERWLKENNKIIEI
jgi:hypothetical protein